MHGAPVSPKQAPLTQVPEPLQTFPHAPQLLLSVFVLVPQPATGLPEQLAKPASQMMPQAPALQVGDPFRVEHVVEQEPQLATFVWVLTQAPPQ